jgi:UDP-3-O-[3-hydroxymyristoyl] glucosamine N-acyltransferase
MVSISSEEIVRYLSQQHPSLDATHCGDESEISGVDKLISATQLDLTYATQYDEETDIIRSDAGVIICNHERVDLFNGTRIAVSEPRSAFIFSFDNFFREQPSECIIHPSAVVADEAVIGNQCVIGSNVYIGPEVKIGDNCVIQAGTSIGGDGFGYARDASGSLYKQAHVGGVIIGDNVELGSNNSIDTGIFDPTVIETGTKTDNLVHIAHEASVGPDVLIAYCCGLSGNARVENHCYLHPGAMVANHTSIGEGCEIGMHASVLDDIEPYSLAVGTPAERIGESTYAN